MQVTAYALSSDGRLEPVDLEPAAARARGRKGLHLFDLVDPDQRVRAGFMERLAVDADTIDQLSEQGHAARVLPLQAGLYFELPSAVAGEPAELRSIGLLCLDTTILLMRRREIQLDALVGKAGLSGVRAEEQSVSGLIVALLRGSSLTLRETSSRLRHRVVLLSRSVDTDPAEVPADAISALKRDIADADAVAAERVAVFERLDAMDSPLLESAEVKDGFRVSVSNTEATSRRLERLERRAIDLKSQHDSYKQDLMNQRLSRLTIISAIFLPLTLIAGIYGMNFESMPELRYPYAYPITLAVMAILGLGMLWWFRRRGWMD